MIKEWCPSFPHQSLTFFLDAFLEDVILAKQRDDFQTSPLWVWLWLIAGGLAFFLVIEAEKLIIRSSENLRRSITAVEAGA